MSTVCKVNSCIETYQGTFLAGEGDARPVELTRYTKEIVQKQCRDGNMFSEHIQSMCRLNMQLA